MQKNRIYEGECVDVMIGMMPDNFVDLTVTSPPYDDLRSYKVYTFDYEPIARQLYRVTKPGGVVFWVVGDETTDGSESGNSFRQALYFKKIGFNLHDTMIYQKDVLPRNDNRYQDNFEYMFVFSKGAPKTFNPIMVPCKHAGSVSHSRTARKKDGTMKKVKQTKIKEKKIKPNIWRYVVGYMKTTTDEYAYDHPAMFPEKLARDHIRSWSNPGDLVFDPMCGAGTTCKMAKMEGREFIGIEMSQEYCQIARKRVQWANPPLFAVT
jgi:site-specific DNA-methyltransferase (adenine-specific)